MPKKAHDRNKKVANSLVALSSAAVLAVYSAGYVRTKAAAEQLEARTAHRRLPEARPAQSGFPAAAEAVPGRSLLPAAAASHETAGNPNLTASIDAPRSLPASPGQVADSPAPASPAPAPPESAAQPAVPGTTVQPAAPASVPAPDPPEAPKVLPPPSPASVDVNSAAVAAAAPAKPVWKDGTYQGLGSCRHGQILAEVRIEGGRIAVASIADCRTRYSCSVISKLPPQVAERQSANVDYVSGATQSADAFYDAVMEALAKAEQK